jgi:hypothetical protein
VSDESDQDEDSQEKPQGDDGLDEASTTEDESDPENDDLDVEDILSSQVYSTSSHSSAASAASAYLASLPRIKLLMTFLQLSHILLLGSATVSSRTVWPSMFANLLATLQSWHLMYLSGFVSRSVLSPSSAFFCWHSFFSFSLLV